MTLALRRMRRGEEDRLYDVLRAAVRGGTEGHYDRAQRQAWAPDAPFEGWVERLGMAECFVAMLGGRVVGFVATTPDGHVDLAYVLPEVQETGVAHHLLLRAEIEMRLMGVRRMTTGASLVARTFFERHGFRVLAEETVTRSGQELRRLRMAKELSAQDSQAS